MGRHRVRHSLISQGVRPPGVILSLSRCGKTVNLFDCARESDSIL